MACRYKYKNNWYSEEEVKKEISKDTSIENVLTEFLSQMSYTIEINTAKEISKYSKTATTESQFYYNNATYEDRMWDGYFKNNIEISQEEFQKASKEYHSKRNTETQPTQHYSNLTVNEDFYKNNPDWEYKEQRITTPLITPSIKGHAQFAENNDIGWFRAWYNKKTGEVHVLEVQSDLFQKGRDKESLTYSYFENEQIQTYRDNIKLFKEKGYTELAERRQKELDEILNQDDKLNKNQFLQLLNKDNNWVTFFIKAIIQSTAKQTVTEVQEEDVENMVKQLEREGKLKINCQ